MAHAGFSLIRSKIDKSLTPRLFLPEARAHLSIFCTELGKIFCITLAQTPSEIEMHNHFASKLDFTALMTPMFDNVGRTIMSHVKTEFDTLGGRSQKD